MKKYIYTILFNLIIVSGFSQVSNLSIDDIYEHYRDSISKSDYPWHLPVMGGKLREMGFDLPYPNGVMVNYTHSSMNIVINELEVGFNPDNLVNVDGLARFQSIKSNVNAVIAKYDFYLLPFVNFFAMAGHIASTTDVQLKLPIDLQFQTQNAGNTFGWGTVVAGGVGPMIMAANFVQSWTFIPSLEKPSKTTVVDGRVGYMYRFKRHPDRNLVFLVGTQYLGLNPQSKGNADLEKLVGITPEKKEQASEQLDAWYEDLSDAEQEFFGGLYDGLSGWLNNPDPASIYYTFQKRLNYPMSMTAGVNFQLSHRFQFTGIYTFLGSREGVTLGVNYRFGWRGKNLLRGLTL